jgi:hypothetical protein
MEILNRVIHVASIIASIIVIVMGFAIFSSGQPIYGLIFLVLGLIFVNIAARTLRYIIFGIF